MHELHFRPATPQDEDFLRELHWSALGKYVRETMNWEKEDMDHSVERWFRSVKEGKPHQVQIIQIKLPREQSNFSFESSPLMRDAGLLSLQESGSQIFLENILLLPEFQNQGIGQQILDSLIQDAEAKRIPIVLLVLKSNPARKLYERLGFEITFEDRTHFHMKRLR